MRLRNSVPQPAGQPSHCLPRLRSNAPAYKRYPLGTFAQETTLSVRRRYVRNFLCLFKMTISPRQGWALGAGPRPDAVRERVLGTQCPIINANRRESLGAPSEAQQLSAALWLIRHRLLFAARTICLLPRHWQSSDDAVSPAPWKTTPNRLHEQAVRQISDARESAGCWSHPLPLWRGSAARSSQLYPKRVLKPPSLA
jgi:hypothetical protein